MSSHCLDVDLVSWLERVEAAREALGWSGRRLAREAGLGNPGNYGVLVQRLRSKGSAAAPSAQTVEAINAALRSAGRPVDAEPVPAPAPAPLPPQSAPATGPSTPVATDPLLVIREVLAALVEDGHDREQAKRALGAVALDPDADLSALHLFRAAKRALAQRPDPAPTPHEHGRDRDRTTVRVVRRGRAR